MSQKKYLIIAGTSKAGTTSLFNYLGSHPNIQPAIIKQTYFFLDKEMQNRLHLNSLYKYEDGLSQFDNFFNKPNSEKYLLESSPDYLYASGTPYRLKKYFQDKEGKILFILRDPVSRLVSFFHFGKQQGLIPEEMKFKDYYFKSKHYTEGINTCLLAYKTGFYAEYLSEYFNVIGRKNIHVLFFEDLKKNPQKFMVDLSRILKIEPEFYNNYKFAIKNETIKIKNKKLRDIYLKFREIYIHNFYRSKIGIVVGDILRNTVSQMYRAINFEPLKKTEIESEILNQIRDDYKEENQRLEECLNQKIPWV
jgi:hypothetical protein